MSVASDERFTPEWLREVVEVFVGGPVGLDVCTSEANPMGADEFYTPTGHYFEGAQVLGSRGDGLKQGWNRDVDGNWCNPPYSRGEVIQWAGKAVSEARDGCDVLMLTRSDVRTGWFKLLRENCDAVCLINRSVGFVLPDGTQLPGDSVGHALWYFGRQRARFRRIFEPLGWVVDGPGVQDTEGAADAAE